MKSGKIKAMLMAGMLTMSLCAGTAVMAEEVQVPTVGQAGVTKNLHIAEGITVPDTTFTFNIIQTHGDETTVAKTTTAAFKADAVTGDLVSKAATTELADATKYPHAGVYTFTVNEVKGNVVGMTYDTKSYTVNVYVVNDDDGLKVDSITANDGTEKVTNMSFDNIYVKDSSLTIEKKVIGAQADKTKHFNFTINMTKAFTDTRASYTGKIVTGDKCKKNHQNVVLTFDDTGRATANVELCDGDKITFDEIAAGTRYTVTEVGAADGYTPSVAVVENGEKAVQTNADSDDDGITADNKLIGEKANSVVFTNAYADTPITGVIINNLPYVVLAAAAVCALVALVLINRRRQYR